MFKEINNRDAWSTLRGFVYQVDTTILRWLNLKDHEILELEKGEDIDIITRDLKKNEVSRELEQIKYRESKISLNQQTSIDLFFNFFNHRKNNPSHKLLFRFVTNAGFAQERPALFVDGKTGIEAWMELFNSEVISKDDQRFSSIKRHLIKKIEENISSQKGKLKKTWIEFKLHLESDDNLKNFIKNFEWSLRNINSVQIGESVKKKLIELELAKDGSNAEIIYPRLFLFVFKLLCQRNLKGLKRSDLDNQVALKKLDSGNQKLLEVITAHLKNLDARVQNLEESVSVHTKQISTLIKGVTQISNSDSVFDYRLKNLSITPPSIIMNGSLREKKVSAIINLFNKFSWISFQGINGTGKSQLAALICSKFKTFYWLDLRAYNDNVEKAVLLLETFLSQISNIPIIGDRKLWMEKVGNSLPNDTLIVLNDIPRVEQNSALREFFILLSQSIKNSGVKLLTTSNFKIPEFLIQSLHQNVINEYYDFNFSDEEILELMINHGANENVLNYHNLIAGISHRNTRITAAIIQNLKAINWGRNSVELFDVILKKEFSEEILTDVQLSIQQFIKDADSRELLYRLSLLSWYFKLNEVKVISQVDEVIIHPNEKLQDLVNIWIQNIGDSFQISPLIADIGEKNLAKEKIEHIHLAIAKSILTSGNLNQITASRSISSFIKGKDYNNAGKVLLNVYQSAKTIEQIKHLDEWSYLHYWVGIDIPKEMDIKLRTLIRNEQIRLHKKIGRDPKHFIEKLREYSLEQVPNSDKLVIHVFNLLNLTNSESKDLVAFWIHLEFILDNLEELDKYFKGAIRKEMISSMLWYPIQNMITETDIKKWLSLIKNLENKLNLDFFENDLVQTALTVLSGNIVNAQNPNLEVAQNRESNTTLLLLLASYFKERKKDVLFAVVYKEIIAVKFQEDKRVDAAEEFTKQLSGEISNNEAKYLFFENLGKLFYNNGNIEKSIEWLFKALNFNCTSQANFIDTLVYGAAAMSKSDPKMAVALCKKATELAKTRKDYSEVNYIQLLCELAIAYWRNTEFENCFSTFSEIINRLFKTKQNSIGKDWKRILMISGHCLGYISSMLTVKKVPQKNDEDFVEPYQGIFVFSNKDFSDLYIEKNEPMLFANMAFFADGINNVHAAYDWSLKAFDLARKNGDQEIFLMIAATCTQYALINFKLQETLESQLLFSAISSHFKGDFKGKQEQLRQQKISEILDVKPSKNWNDAEETTITYAILPLFIIVLTAEYNNTAGYYSSFNKLLIDYLPNSSNKTLWEVVMELTSRIVDKNITERELIDRANTFGSQGQKGKQLICILGMIHSSNNIQEVLKHIINLFPYLTKLNSSSRNSVKKFVLAPFIKIRCERLIKENFKKDKRLTSSLLKTIQKVDVSNSNAIQLILQPIVKTLELQVEEDRRLWLYNLEEI